MCLSVLAVLVLIVYLKVQLLIAPSKIKDVHVEMQLEKRKQYVMDLETLLKHQFFVMNLLINLASVVIKWRELEKFVNMVQLRT